MDSSIIAIVTVYAYDDKSSFVHYAGHLDGFDFFTHCELSPELVRLFTTQIVQPILFTGDQIHDNRAWAQLKSYDNFLGFIEAMDNGYHPGILLIPKTYLSYYRSKFRKYGIYFQEHGMTRSISDKYCRLGIYENVPGVYCEVITEPCCIN